MCFGKIKNKSERERCGGFLANVSRTGSPMLPPPLLIQSASVLPDTPLGSSTRTNTIAIVMIIIMILFGNNFPLLNRCAFTSKIVSHARFTHREIHSDFNSTLLSCQPQSS